MLHNRFNPLYAAAEDAPPANPGTAPAAPEAAPEKDAAGDEKKDEEPEPEPEPAADPAAAPEAAAPGKLNAFQRTALRALGTGDLIARVERAEAGEAVALAEVARLKTENTRLTADLAQIKKETPAQIEAAKQVREKDVSTAMRNELGKLGITSEIAPSQVNAEATPEAMLEHFATLKGAEKTAYWRANSKALKIAEASAKSK